jgi:hypothetical protein
VHCYQSLQPDTENGENGKGAGHKMAKKRLKSLEDCRRYLAGLINRTESGEMDQQTASKLAYIANILISCVKDASLEERVTRLEKTINGERSGER